MEGVGLFHYLFCCMYHVEDFILCNIRRNKIENFIKNDDSICIYEIFVVFLQRLLKSLVYETPSENSDCSLNFRSHQVR